MDRKRKLYLIVGGALILVVFVVTALILSAQKRNTPPEPAPEETPALTATPTIEPVASPTATPSGSGLPDISVLPGETEAPAPTPTATVTPTPSPTPTTKPTAVPSPQLPSGSSNTSPPATATPKPAVVVVEPAGFDFSIPARASTRAQVAVTVSNGTNVQNVTWATTKSGFLGIQGNAGSDVTGTLTNTGGTLAFASPGAYTVTATVKTTDGKTQTVSRSIEIKESDTFNFSMPRTAYTDTVVHVQMLNGSEAATWEVMKDGSAIEQSAAFAGTLYKTGGMITFRGEGKYTLTGTSSAGGKVSVDIIVKVRG